MNSEALNACGKVKQDQRQGLRHLCQLGYGGKPKLPFGAQPGLLLTYGTVDLM